MLARRACDGEHVVERHRDVSDRDLPDGLTKRLLAAAVAVVSIVLARRTESEMSVMMGVRAIRATFSSIPKAGERRRPAIAQ